MSRTHDLYDLGISQSPKLAYAVGTTQHVDQRWRHSHGIVFGASLATTSCHVSPSPTSLAPDMASSSRGYKTTRPSTADPSNASARAPTGMQQLDSANRYANASNRPAQKTNTSGLDRNTFQPMSAIAEAEKVKEEAAKLHVINRELATELEGVNTRGREERRALIDSHHKETARLNGQLAKERRDGAEAIASLTQQLEEAKHPHTAMRRQLKEEIMPQLREESRRLAEEALRDEIAKARLERAQQDKIHRTQHAHQEKQHQQSRAEQERRHQQLFAEQENRHRAKFESLARQNESKLRDMEIQVRKGVYERKPQLDNYATYRAAFLQFNQKGFAAGATNAMQQVESTLRDGLSFVDKLPNLGQRMQELCPDFVSRYPELHRALDEYESKHQQELQNDLQIVDSFELATQCRDHLLESHKSRDLTRTMRQDKSSDLDLADLILNVSLADAARNAMTTRQETVWQLRNSMRQANHRDRRELQARVMQADREYSLLKWHNLLNSCFRRLHKTQSILTQAGPEKAVFLAIEAMDERHTKADRRRRLIADASVRDKTISRRRRQDLDALATLVYRRALREQRVYGRVTGSEGFDVSIRLLLASAERDLDRMLARLSTSVSTAYKSDLDVTALGAKSWSRAEESYGPYSSFATTSKQFSPTPSLRAAHDTLLSPSLPSCSEVDWIGMTTDFATSSSLPKAAVIDEGCKPEIESLSATGEKLSTKETELESTTQPTFPGQINTELDFKIPAKEFQHAVTATAKTAASFWTYKRYRSSEGAQPTQHYCRTFEQAEEQAQKFLNEPVLGFDLEWEIGASPEKSGIRKSVSLIQLAAEDKIALFHLGIFQGDTIDKLMPPSLRRILESDSIVKTGVNVAGDARRMKLCLDVEMQGLFELSHLYRVVEYSEQDPSKVNRVLVSLAEQVQTILGLPLAKEDSVRTGAWSRRLNAQQTEYACSDAYAGFQLYHTLEAKRKCMEPTPPRPAFYELFQPLVLGNGTAVPLVRPRPKVAKQVALPDEQDNDEFFDALETQDTTESAEVTDGETATTASVSSCSNTGYATSVPSEEVIQAEAWIAERRASSRPELKNPASHAQLRAYHLWHEQDMSVGQVAAALRTPPLANSTVASYIMAAVKQEDLPFDAVRMRAPVEYLSIFLHQRYQKIIDHVNKTT